MRLFGIPPIQSVVVILSIAGTSLDVSVQVFCFVLFCFDIFIEV